MARIRGEQAGGPVRFRLFAEFEADNLADAMDFAANELPANLQPGEVSNHLYSYRLSDVDGPTALIFER